MLDEGIIAVSLHPGVVKTEFLREYEGKLTLVSIFYFILSPILNFLMKTCKQGAQTTIHCAVSDEIPDRNGLYFS